MITKDAGVDVERGYEAVRRMKADMSPPRLMKTCWAASARSAVLFHQKRRTLKSPCSSRARTAWVPNQSWLSDG